MVPIWTMPDRLGSSVEVTSSARAQRRQRRVATWTGGRVAESMLCRTIPELADFEDGRSKSEDEKVEEVDEVDEDEDVDDVVPA